MEVNRPDSSLDSMMGSTAASPTFLIDASPTRSAVAPSGPCSIEYAASLRLTLGPSTWMFSRRHSRTMVGILSRLSAFAFIRQAMYSAG